MRFVPFLSLLIAAAAAQPAVYRSDPLRGDIYRVDVATGATELVRFVLRDPFDVAIDPEGGHLYWSDDETNKVQRSNLDGSGAVDLFQDDVFDPRRIAIDRAGGFVYVADAARDALLRGPLGGGVVELVRDLGPGAVPWGIAVDEASGMVYWTDRGSGVVARAPLAGGDADTLWTGRIPSAIALDLRSGHAYWTDASLGLVVRSGLDGSDPDTLATGVGSPYDLELDLDGGRIFWVTRQGTLTSAMLDGGDVRTREGIDVALTGLTRDPSTGALFLTGHSGLAADPAIYRTRFDRTSLDPVVAPAGGIPRGIAVAEERLYWATSRAVWSERLDRTDLRAEVEDERFGVLVGLARDAATGRLYWSDIFEDRIQRTAETAVGYETVVFSQPHTSGLALDATGDTLYWSDFADGRISRAPVDGSTREDLHRGLSGPRQLAVDSEARHLYWAEGGRSVGEGRIRRSALDGTSAVTLVDGLTFPSGLALDLAAERLYWTDQQGGLHRAHLDGSGQTLIANVHVIGAAQLALAPGGSVSREAGPARDGLQLGILGPNPTRDRVEVQIEVDTAGGVRVDVVDALGRVVAVLHDGPLAPGHPWRLSADVGALAAGRYLVRAVGGGVVRSEAVTVAR